jgi:hypothetical protein
MRLGFGKYMAEKRFDAIMTAFALPRHQKNHDATTDGEGI